MSDTNVSGVMEYKSTIISSVNARYARIHIYHCYIVIRELSIGRDPFRIAPQVNSACWVCRPYLSFITTDPGISIVPPPNIYNNIYTGTCASRLHLLLRLWVGWLVGWLGFEGRRVRGPSSSPTLSGASSQVYGSCQRFFL